jgi:hypothetical protein
MNFSGLRNTRFLSCGILGRQRRIKNKSRDGNTCAVHPVFNISASVGMSHQLIEIISLGNLATDSKQNQQNWSRIKRIGFLTREVSDDYPSFAPPPPPNPG